MVCAGVNQLTKYNDFMSHPGSDLFDTDNKLADINSYDASIMEKIKLMEGLNDEEKKIVFSLVDALVGTKKLKDALSNVLTDIN